MYLQEVTIRNIKCFEDIKLDFRNADGSIRLWNVIVGENGTGKTTLLQAIAIALLGQKAASVLLPRPSGWVRAGAQMGDVDCPAPSAHTAALLARRRRERRGWECRNPRRVRGDAETNEVLRQAFHGKCGYCEHVEANTIDHFWPRHPSDDEAHRHNQGDRTWDWDNFILACSVCQGHKLEKLPVSPDDHWMVNPRIEEPLGFLRINLQDGKIYFFARFRRPVPPGQAQNEP